VRGRESVSTKPELAALQILSSAGVKRPPVPVDRIVRDRGISLVFQPFEGNISGMSYRGGSRKVIGVNSSHPAVRQRFTVAHELGHLELHPGKPMILDHVIRVDFRDQRAATATDRQEIEANQFAAELLMPRDWVFGEVVRRTTAGVEPEDDALVAALANRFRVSQQAMQFRLVNLGLRRLL
jgi:Zn-dependent peptidase ImmA (M78 family)